jgi:hypothetical protein
MFSSRVRIISPVMLTACACALVVLFAVGACAQSGRRATKPLSSTPAPPPDTKPVESSSSEKKPAVKADLTLVLAANRDDVAMNIPPYFNDSVLQSCARRLDDAVGVHVDVESRPMNRSDAIKTAKTEKEAYFVLLELRSDGNNSNASYDSIYIQYTVFGPTNANVKASGNVYQSMRSGGVLSPKTTTERNGSIIAETRLKDAARSVAERILKALNFSTSTPFPRP